MLICYKLLRVTIVSNELKCKALRVYLLGQITNILFDFQTPQALIIVF